MADFPTSVPSITNPTANDTLAAVPHHEQHEHANDNLAAIGTKLGTGSSTPVINQALMGSGTGTSAWRTRYDFHVTDYGADPTGNSGSAAAFQAAIDAAEANGGGVVHVAPGLYKINTALVANAGVLLKGPTPADVHTATNGSGPTNARPIIQWNGSAGATMFTIQPATVGSAVWGGGSVDIEWDAAGVADVAVHFDNTKSAVFDGKIRRTLVAGLKISSISGSISNFSWYNRVESLEFVIAASGAGLASHGLWLMGNEDGTIPSTQQHIMRVFGLYDSGNLIHLTATDNCQFLSVSGASLSTGSTGKALNIYDSGGTARANHCLFVYFGGKVAIHSDVIGTRFLHYHAESAAMESTGVYWAADIRANTSPGRLWRSHGYKQRDRLALPAASFLASAAITEEDVASQWRGFSLPASGNSAVSALIPPPYDWYDGDIEAIDIYYSTNGTAGGNVVLAIKAEVEDVATAMSNPSANETATIAQASQWKPVLYTHTFGTPVAFNHGEFIAISIGRTPLDAADTATDEWIFLGARLWYSADGPPSPSGPWVWTEWDD